MKIDILPNYYLKNNETFNLEEALLTCGKIAGVCYDKEGFKHLENEPVERTNRRIDRTINNGHHSVYDHISISFNIQNIPKILAMIINNEHQYTTSEKSARYTPIKRSDNGIISFKEEELYNKWLEILKIKIKYEYGNTFDDSKIQKLAQENARYFVTVFMPTQMIYTTSLRQINYLVAWMKDYIRLANPYNEFETKLAVYMCEFCSELKQLNVLHPGLQDNEKCRNLSLFGKNLNNINEYFSYVYLTNYKGSFASLAQAQRHRTLDYKIELLDKKEYYVPPILLNDSFLVKEWLQDMEKVANIFPQGEIILINEMGKYEDFILKCKERLCSAAQLEIMRQTKDTLIKYRDTLIFQNNPLKDDIVDYCNGARCTFKDFTCTEKCGLREGITLSRKI